MLPVSIHFNVLLHALDGNEASVITRYDWFQDQSASGNPVFDEHFFSSHVSFNGWEHRPFPLFS